MAAALHFPISILFRFTHRLSRQFVVLIMAYIFKGKTIEKNPHVENKHVQMTVLSFPSTGGDLRPRGNAVRLWRVPVRRLFADRLPEVSPAGVAHDHGRRDDALQPEPVPQRQVRGVVSVSFSALLGRRFRRTFGQSESSDS